MATLSKIFITIIFVLSSLFLGFAIAKVADRNDNPKYKYMRELRLRRLIKFDIKRLEKSILEEQGKEGTPGKYGKAVASLSKRYNELKSEIEKSNTETQKETSSLLCRLSGSLWKHSQARMRTCFTLIRIRSDNTNLWLWNTSGCSWNIRN